MESKGNADASPRELYLDLLIKTLTNVIYGDPSTNPESAGPFQSELRFAGRDWPAVAHTMIGVRRLENVRELAQRVIDEGVPGDLAEAGVWRGGCCILMRGILAANAIKDRKVYVIDSFEGLPPPKPAIFPQDQNRQQLVLRATKRNVMIKPQFRSSAYRQCDWNWKEIPAAETHLIKYSLMV